MAVDIGNTNITCGLFAGEELTAVFRLRTIHNKTSDEYGIDILNQFSFHEFCVNELEGVVISNVIPHLTSPMNMAFSTYFSKNPLWFHEVADQVMKITYKRPEQLGCDRVVNGFMAYNRFKRAVIVVDIGTAITVDFVSEEGEFRGGAIAPGVEAAMDGLLKKAPRLPRITLESPESSMGTDTQSCLLSGMIFGYSGLIDGIVTKIAEESGTKPRVIATGGWAHVIAPYTKMIDEVDERLTLHGLRLIYSRLT